ncbi:M-phase inducer phosphatase-like [Argopecten irradians]|uniref:M-phase inducer phosphatase-like n=1 Tax=Argopecten irradians TaxID=31199 RepID=UPI003720F006
MNERTCVHFDLSQKAEKRLAHIGDLSGNQEFISPFGTPGFERKNVNSNSTVRKSLFSNKRVRTTDGGTIVPKRHRCSEGDEIIMDFDMLSFKERHTPPKCKPEFVIRAVNKFVEHEDVTGNGSQSYCLPTILGKHSDLKSITSSTLSDVMDGHFDDVIGSYRIIDCRYPYEFESGHIRVSSTKKKKSIQ